jgi:phage/plasmid-associated DNA primase
MNKKSQNIGETILFSDSEDEYEVESKSSIHDEISIRVQERHEEILREFKEFLNNPEYINGKNDPNTNIVDRKNMTNGIYSPICYNIPDNKIPKFFKYLEICRRKNLIMMMYEKQLEYSGIMLDFDIMQDHGQTQIDQFLYNKLCTIIGQQLYKYIDINNSITKSRYNKDYVKLHIVFTKKPKVVFNEEKQYFKDGFHMLIPGIKINKETKKFFIEQCLNNKIFTEIFRDIKPAQGYTIEDFVDKNSAHVPVHFIGSSTKINTPAYVLDDAYEIRLYLNSDNTSIMPLKCVDLFSEKTNSNIILVNELSLNWERNLDKNGIIEKLKYNVREEYLSQIVKFKPNIDFNDIENINDENSELSLLKIHDPDVEFIKALLDTLHSKRYEDFDLWFKVLCVLAHTSKSYKPLGEYFSKKSTTKFNVLDFEKFWNQSMDKKKNYLTIGSLHHWAKIDNPDRYEEIRHRSMFNTIYKKIYDPQIEGCLQHYDIAEILYKSLKYKYIYDPDNGGIWYEFILEGEPQKKGEIYKWRSYKKAPNSIKRYMSEILPLLFRKILDKIQSAYAESSGDLANYHFMIKKNFQASCKKLRDSGFKTGVSNECEQLFERIDFSSLLDKDANIMGVGNGILKLGEKVKLITGIHNYYVSNFTSVDYKEFNPYDPITKKLIIALRNLFPDKEPDSFDFMMHYLASGLDGKKKESIFLIFIGGGSNGKSFLMELNKSVSGDSYGGKVPLSFLTSFTKNSEGATPVLMSIIGKRSIYLSEANKCERANCARVKEITGLESLAGRKLFGEMVNFKPTSNITLTTNHLLEFDSNDHGMWRRIKIVPAKMKFCKKNVDELDKNNPYEREADLSLARDWSEDEDVQASYLGLMAYYYESLQKNYNGVVENVPHPHIKQATESYRNKQDHINNFINMKIVKTSDTDSEITMDLLIEKYSRWYESLHPDDKSFKKGLQQVFENSKLSNVFTNTEIGKIIKGYRILDNNERLSEGEVYFKDIFKINNNQVPINKIKKETSLEFYERLCKEFDSNQIIKNNKNLSEKKKINEFKKEKTLNDNINEPVSKETSNRNNNLTESVLNTEYDKSGFKIKSLDKSILEFIDCGDVSESDSDDEAIHESSDNEDSD